MNLRPYSPFKQAGPLLAISGQTGFRGESLVSGGFVPEFHQALDNLKRATEAAGYELSDIFKVTVFLVDMSRLDEGNRIYMEFFGDHRPARSTIAATALPRNAQCEIEAWAWRP